MPPKNLIFLSIVILFTLVSADALGQCAMCKAVAESAGEKQAEGLNKGIIFLMIVPYLVMGTIALVIRKYNKQ
ncbi:MAG: hypothetical protein JKY53_14600 [Flavobacteriales bacterium]|nr:hypothetical protein [Flavobacteriales bacterium]